MGAICSDTIIKTGIRIGEYIKFYTQSHGKTRINYFKFSVTKNNSAYQAIARDPKPEFGIQINQPFSNKPVLLIAPAGIIVCISSGTRQVKVGRVAA